MSKFRSMKSVTIGWNLQKLVYLYLIVKLKLTVIFYLGDIIFVIDGIIVMGMNVMCKLSWNSFIYLWCIKSYIYLRNVKVFWVLGMIRNVSLL